ncbi:hypothetical protein KEC56_07375 [Microbacterium sp. YMB-B2]|uniref:Uncharacterized protein n=1 Tax=Microbacterium tenebrionis TaxID=2830665 RepID=A0A9X1S0K0_9MICO|nr:hypothetical protein [Microbacterium tenebrionis]MCC2029337.1 hypothetical protein [Microbacterium tenebrionis]
MSDGQPRPEWIFPEEKKRDKGRIWLIVGLSVIALAIVGTLLFFLLPREGAPVPSPSPTASSTTSSPTPTSDSTPTPTSAPTSTSEPAPSQPPAADPGMDVFVEKVRPRLDDGVRGLQLVQDNMDLGAQIVDSLQNDAAVLSDTPAPSSVAAEWSDMVTQYSSKLGDLRAAYDNGSDPHAPLEAASTALQKVRALVGL